MSSIHLIWGFPFHPCSCSESYYIFHQELISSRNEISHFQKCFLTFCPRFLFFSRTLVEFSAIPICEKHQVCLYAFSSRVQLSLPYVTNGKTNVFPIRIFVFSQFLSLNFFSQFRKSCSSHFHLLIFFLHFPS